MVMALAAELTSRILGWLYFAAWTASFYPQAYLHWKRKKVDGLSLEFLYINILGFTCYAIYNTSMYYSSSVRQEYQSRHGGELPAVQLNDIVFAVHAFLMTGFQLFQTFIYDLGPHQKVSKRFVTLFLTVLAVIAATLIGNAAGWLSALDFLYVLGWIKLIGSFIKYLPQLWLNRKRRSTDGWSIENILLDVIGGLLSILQLFIDSFSSATHPWEGIKGNLPKLGLGLVSLGFDSLFMTQHYILYPHRNDDAEAATETDPLLQ